MKKKQNGLENIQEKSKPNFKESGNPIGLPLSLS